MKKIFVALIHIGYWLCYFLLAIVILGVLYGREQNAPSLSIETAFTIIVFFALVPSAICFYSFYYIIFPKFIIPKKIWPAIGLGILIALFSGITGTSSLNTFIAAESCTAEEENDTILGLTLFISFISLISGVIALVIRGCLTWIDEIKLKEALKRKNQEMELALVKSQLDPHFLFNTINNIDVLILKDAEEASVYLNKLSDIMRFMLFETKTEKIPLEQEVQYIKKYIELQRIRTANPDYVTFEVQGNIEHIEIAPMAFICFIENAFKHTTNKKLKHAIHVNIQVTEKGVMFKCTNKLDVNRHAEVESNGLGNQLIQKRLQLIYPNSHELITLKENDQYNVQLTIWHE